MKNHYTKTLLLLLVAFFVGHATFAQGVAINEDNSNADNSAILDVKSTNKGMLIPRMTTAQRGLISSPATGLLVFDTDTETFWFRTASGWDELTSETNDDVVDGDASSTNEIQSLSSTTSGTNRTINISGSSGTTISVADNDNNSSNELQTISKSGSTVSLSNGGGTFTDAVNDADASPSNELQTISKSGSTVTLSNGGGSFTDAVNDGDASSSNEIQSLSSTTSGTNRTINISGSTGTTISVADNDNNSSNELQNLSSASSGTNRTINISGGAGTTISVADNDNSSSNEIQSLSISGSTISLSSGGSVSVPSSADNLGNHSATTTLDMNNNDVREVRTLITQATSNYDKIRVYSSSNYTIGMASAQSFGSLNDWAMTFTMNADLDRGFLWRDVSDAASDGAMSLTTGGILTVKQDVRAPRFYDYNNTAYYVDPASASQMNDVRANIFYDRNNTTYFMNPASATSGRMEGDWQIGYGSSTDDDNLYFDRNAEYIRWDESETEFLFSDDIQSGGDFVSSAFNGVINCGGSLNANANVIGDFTPSISFASGDEDLWIEDDLEVRSQAYKPGGGSWATTSDKRLKRDVQPFNDGLNSVLQINPVKFKYIEGHGDLINPDREFIGVLAQDMEEIAPYTVEEISFGKIVKENEEGADEVLEEGEKFLTFDPSSLDYMLINAIQEQQKIIEELKNEIEALKAE